MPRIAAEEAEQLLTPYMADFVEVARRAWSDWLASSIAPNMQHKRVRANNVWNQMITHAQRIFEGRAGISVAKFRGTWDGLLVGDRVFIRMKKGNERLLSSNVRTATALAFNDPEEDLFEGLVRLELVYVLDKLETSIDRVAVVQRDQSSVVWMLDLLKGDENTQNVLPFAPAPDQGTGASVADRVLKPRKEEHADDGNSEQVDDRRLSS